MPNKKFNNASSSLGRANARRLTWGWAARNHINYGEWIHKVKKKHVPQEMHQDQVRNIIKFIDASQSEAIKETIFSQLGHECFYARHLDALIEPYQNNVQAFLDRVNVEKASKYWERLEFTEDGTTLILTGKKVEGCACAFADCADPPL